MLSMTQCGTIAMPSDVPGTSPLLAALDEADAAGERLLAALEARRIESERYLAWLGRLSEKEGYDG